MNKKNMRRVSILVTAQTLGNLEKLAAMSGYREVGRVVDKLVREKMISLNPQKKEKPKKLPVMCKDCKHYQTADFTDGFTCYLAEGIAFAKEDDFCSRAERKN